MKKKSLRGELLFWTFIACFIPYLLGCFFIEKTVARQVREDFGAYAQSVISKVHTRINDGAIKPAYEAVTLLAMDDGTLSLINSIGNQQITDTNNELLDIYQGFTKYTTIFSQIEGLALGTEQGGYFEYPDYFTQQGYDPRTRPWYQAAMKNRGQACLTDPYIMHTTGEMVVAVARAVEHHGNPVGVVVTGWNLMEFQREVEELKIGLSGYVMILNKNNKIIVSPRHREWLMRTPQELHLPDAFSEVEDGKIQQIMLDGKNRLICVDRSAESGWKVVAVMDEEELQTKVGMVLRPVLVAYFATLMIIFSFIFLLTQKYVAEPIKSLKEGAEAIAAGDLAARVKLQNHNEFGALAAAFNEMAEKLQSNFARIREQNALLYKREKEFQTLVENAQDIILRIDREGVITYINPVFELYFPRPVRELFGKKLDVLGMPRSFQEEIDTVFREEKPEPREHVIEFPFRSSQGSTYWLQAHIIPEFYEREQPDTILSVIRNITQQRKMEKQMARLEKLGLVREMAAGLAHEVRNPMTTVRGFLQMIASKESGSSHASYYHIMIEELDRANNIISEFLSLAKNKAINPVCTNLNDVIHAIAPLIQADAAINNKTVSLELEPVPDLLLDKQEIHQLLLNMVRNGLEAMPGKGTVRIKTYLEDRTVVLAIADQGGGIQKEILEHIGIPFQTTKESAAGLGLAICYSIASRHKAQITVHTGSQGTEFFVHFPVMP
ncbi:hypothetical protein P22_2036 [Propionispora sp. 2/2-37]|uniref:PAS domain-containing sensor histidine kinase n=1 Tax=Propionispora sp. 2/2-37 TaxID=1677858 RepID=UPI0006BB992D|nr:PAS domain-containing sensor histidine kinase [Propionispora sp. 2/2-37]CUH95948.1 hypothetical protein P22_2036 [Propionispora sp. 2/2-37]